MVLSGTLREFILADVFQLLTQQKITGKLILNNGLNEGIVAFKNGIIVAAEKNDENLSNKLFRYLVEIKQIASNKIRELFASYEGDICSLTKEIIQKKYLAESELKFFCESVTEDIICSLFVWNAGKYRFNSSKNIDNLIPANISISSESVIMEAMRRIDEWNRMKGSINENTVFVRNQKDFSKPNIIDPFKATAEYLYNLLDGTSPVKEFISSSCLTEYKIYEGLYELIQQNKVVPLSDKFSSSVQAALEKKKQDQTNPVYSIISSSVLALGIVILIVFSGHFLFNSIILFNKKHESHVSRIKPQINNVKLTIHIAELFYESYYRKKPQSLLDLKDFNLVNDKDLYYYSLEEIIDSEKKRRYNNNSD
ncbi:MAG TPA: DUF4388 domain-containing protein [Chitinispirillaceae bacterium]|nr:DUF4388 domain-containing protein [Chitinispirillaceae bacterium]